MKKTMNKTTKNNFINYGIVIAIFVIVEILSGTGNLSRLLTGLLVPLCVYTIAVARIVGWSAHRMEELINVDKIIRPAYKNVLPEAEYIPLCER